MRQQNGTPVAPPSADSMAEALEEYLEAAAAGMAPPREEFLARYPDLAEQLDACLVALRFIGRAAVGPRSLAAEVADAQPPEEATGRLGDYRLVREVGRGGMGVVYEAEQVSLGRRVALKVLPFAATMDPRQLQRFHNEARAAASLDHPHIVHVHAVGCERAVHFYAMQFIEGQTLAALIADLRQADGRPVRTEEQPTGPHVPGQPAPSAETAPRAAASTDRGPRDRAHFRRVSEWGIQAAEALDHAHALGIVHRDVKPANLLVDGRGNLWVTDFGLAHVQSDARLTITGDLVGTLRYMSPEQALAKRVVVDHRTDVYSLGATLYELLTLEPAYRGTDRQELLRQIAFEEPARPRRVNKAIPAELETIVLKAMEKNAQERYATAAELAEDLRHFLADQPIRARPAGVVRRLRKWGRRHRPLVAAATAAMMAVGAVLSGSIGWVANDRAIRRATTQEGVYAAWEESQTWQRQGRLPEALSAALRAAGLAAGGVADEDLRRRADARVADLRLLEKLENVSLEYASSAKDLPDGRSYFDGELADRLYRDAFRKAALDVADLPAAEAGARIRGTTVAAELAGVLDYWAAIRRDIHGPADPDWNHLLQVARAADPDDWRARLREALEKGRLLLELEASEKVFRLHPTTLHALAKVLPKEARALALLRKAQRRHPDDFWSNANLAAMLLEQHPPEVDEAIRYYTAALAIRPQSAGVHLNLGNALMRKGRRDEAIVEFRAAIHCNGDYAMAHCRLGDALVETGQLDEAIAEHHEALRLNKDNPDAHNSLGVALHAKGQLDEAIAEYRVALQLNKDYAEAHSNLGQALCDKNQLDEAIGECREALRHQKEFAPAHNNLGNALFAKGQLDEAIAEYSEAIQLKKDFALAHNNLGLVLHRKGQLDEAIAECRESIRLNKAYAEAHGNLGAALSDKGRLDEAIEEYREALRLKKDYWEAHANLAIDLHSKGELDEGIAEYRIALRLKPDAAMVHNKFRAALRAKGALDKLPRILKGESRPADANECLALAELCQQPYQRLYAASARFYGEAFTGEPKLAEDLRFQNRYNAACAAALAAAGKGVDAGKLDDKVRARLRQQALDWLRAELTAYRRLLEKEPKKVGSAVRDQMKHWQQDTDFAGVRGPAALAKLSEAERHDWEKLWADVADLLDRAADKPPQPRDSERKP
jgi:tetratricopeptide (TPR) repeat protein